MKAPNDWMPEIAEVARKCYADAIDPQLVHRLGTDRHKLGAVWSGIPPEQRAELFEAACWDLTGMVGTTTQHDFVEQMTALTKLAEELRRVAGTVYGFYGFGQRHLDAMLQLADFFEAHVKKVSAYAGPWITERNRGDPFVRGYALYLSDRFSEILGDPRDKFVARIATVAFGHSVSERTVRNWRTGK